MTSAFSKKSVLHLKTVFSATNLCLSPCYQEALSQSSQNILLILTGNQSESNLACTSNINSIYLVLCKNTKKKSLE